VIRGRRQLVLQPEALEDLTHWVETDRKTALRVLRLIEAVQRSPFEGLGKPEPLRHISSDVWSRRITKQDRLVYRVTDDAIHILQARYHC
jgi:toxin YoeB